MTKGPAPKWPSILPQSMSTFVRTIEAEDVITGRKAKIHHQFASTLMGFATFCMAEGLPVQLCEDTATAYLVNLERRGLGKGSITQQRGHLRKFAYATQEGLDWALLDATTDRRPIEDVLSAPHWAPFIDAARAFLDQDRGHDALRRADRWMRFRRRYDDITVETVFAFSTAKSALQSLSYTMSLLDFGSLDNLVIEAARSKVRSIARPRAPQPRWQDVPDPLRSELLLIEKKAQRDWGLSPSTVEGMGAAVRRLVRSATKRDLPTVLNVETATAFAEDLYEDDIKFISGQTYCDTLERFARLSGYPNDLVSELRETTKAFAELSRGEIRRKVAALAARPLTMEDVADAAHELLMRAPEFDNSRDRRMRYDVAGAAAFLCKLPIRSLDLRSGRVGREFCRDSEGWIVDIRTSKTGTLIEGRLADCLTRYLDTVLLHDTDPVHFWEIYARRSGQPLFSNAMRGGTPRSDGWLWRTFSQMTGHGPHIMRSLVYDACARDGDLDARIASALCGHASPASGKDYEIDADRYRKEAAMRTLALIDARCSQELGSDVDDMQL